MKQTSTSKQFIEIKGNIYWAHIVKPNNKGEYPTNKYEVDLSISDDNATKLKSLGVEVKNKGDERGDFVKLRSLYQPIMTDSEDNEIEVTRLGNGSEVIVTTTLYPNKAKQGGKQCLGLNGIKVINGIPFTPKANKVSLDDM